ncbi:hypothetical protein E2542_SST05126 [Spatholobus suberectus]|nr:hypothetical protein E2542_SST05126 [Spatholobus suberectus]
MKYAPYYSTLLTQSTSRESQHHIHTDHSILINTDQTKIIKREKKLKQSRPRVLTVCMSLCQNLAVVPPSTSLQYESTSSSLPTAVTSTRRHGSANNQRRATAPRTTNHRCGTAPRTSKPLSRRHPQNKTAPIHESATLHPCVAFVENWSDFFSFSQQGAARRL